MLNTPETRYITTPEQGQYWGGFLGEALRLSVRKESRKHKNYYSALIQSYDSGKRNLDYLCQSFGGTVKPQPRHKESNPDNHFLWGYGGFRWSFGRTTESSLTLLKEIQPHMIAQEDLVEVLINFLTAKKDRIEQYQQSYTNVIELTDEREREEAEFFEKFKEAKARPLTIKGPLTIVSQAGVLDSPASRISISRSEWARGSLEYNTRVGISSKNTPLLEFFAQEYDGSLLPSRGGDPPVYSESKFYCSIWRDEQISRLLEDTLPYLSLQKRPAEIALGFIDLQQSLAMGNWKRRGTDLGETLRINSTPRIDLITLLREGFYSEMYRLNHEV